MHPSKEPNGKNNKHQLGLQYNFINAYQLSPFPIREQNLLYFTHAWTEILPQNKPHKRANIGLQEKNISALLSSAFYELPPTFFSSSNSISRLEHLCAGGNFIHGIGDAVRKINIFKEISM